MNRGNRGLNAAAIGLLDVHAGARARSRLRRRPDVRPLLERGATVVGVDRAQDMVDAARARHRADVDLGRSLPPRRGPGALLADGAVDQSLAESTVYFWPDLAPALSELQRVLAPRGRVVTGIRDGSVMEKVDRSIFTARLPAEIAAAPTSAGPAGAEVHSAPDGKTHLITATR